MSRRNSVPKRGPVHAVLAAVAAYRTGAGNVLTLSDSARKAVHDDRRGSLTLSPSVLHSLADAATGCARREGPVWSHDALCEVAAHPNTSDVTLGVLAGHPDPRVRAAVAARRGCPEHVVDILAADRSPAVLDALAANVTVPDSVRAFASMAR